MLLRLPEQHLTARFIEMNDSKKQRIKSGSERLTTSGSVTVCVASNLRKASRLISQIYNDFLKSTGLKGTQLGLLREVKESGGTTITGLAARGTIDRTTITRNLKLLEKKGLVRIEIGADQRERIVTITDEGEKAVAAALQAWKQAQLHVTEVFGKERTGRLLEELQGLISSFQRR